MVPRLGTYEEFWPYYVSEHSRPLTRGLHVFGTSLVLLTLCGAALVSPSWILAAPVAGYGPAWIAHFFVEKNRPATFTYPWWSLRADFRMFRLMLLGRMGPEVERSRSLYPPR